MSEKYERKRGCDSGREERKRIFGGERDGERERQSERKRHPPVAMEKDRPREIKRVIERVEEKQKVSHQEGSEKDRHRETKTNKWQQRGTEREKEENKSNTAIATDEEIRVSERQHEGWGRKRKREADREKEKRAAALWMVFTSLFVSTSGV